MKTILIVEDDINSATALSRILEGQGYEVHCSGSAEEARDRLLTADYDLLIIDLVLPEMDGLTFLKEVDQTHPEILTVIVTAYGSITAAVEALKAGANDFLEKPLVPEKLFHVLNKVFEARQMQEEIVALRSDLVQRNRCDNIIGSHPKMQVIFQLIEAVAGTDAAVLITGETGTGKELVARAIHFQSPRREKPFVAINCASVPEALFESELFGFERGAFTGAVKKKLGKLEQAQGGTVLLDEIGDMPLSVQGKLLRSLQEKKVDRLGNGSHSPVPLDIRIISATNKDLQDQVNRHKFRIDLFYRLNVVPIHIPPLRDRLEDIPLLATHFLEKICGRKGERPPSISKKALAMLMSHAWPGNVREFENVMERALVLNRGETIEDIPFLAVQDSAAAPPMASGYAALPLKAVREKAMARVEKHYLREVLEQYQGSIKKTADHSGINTRTVRRKMKTYGLDKWQFK